MKVEVFGKIYVGLMSFYFLVSGLTALMDIDSKLLRIGLHATDQDGKVAFILIYCSLMIGLGVSIVLIAFLSKTWVYSAVLATSIIISFIIFRFVGSYIVGSMSSVQIEYIMIELVESGVGAFLIIKSDYFQKNARS
jgi:hypothetical protein